MAELTLSVGQSANGSGEPEDTFAFRTAANKKLVLILNGPTSVQAGIWAVDASGEKKKPGLLRVCGAKNVRGCHLFKPTELANPGSGPCVIQVENPTGGAYSLTLRGWSFFDYATINFYKSTC